MTRILDVSARCGVYRQAGDVEPLEVIPARFAETYVLRVDPGKLRALLRLESEIAYALNVPHVEARTEGNVVHIRVPTAQRGPVTFAEAWDQTQPAPARGRLLLGLNDEGQQQVLDLTDPANVHAAVIGMTGSGKTTLMQTMILSAEQSAGDHATPHLALFDPAGNFAPLAGHPAVWTYAQSPAAIADGLTTLAGMVERKRPFFAVFVDEVPDLVRHSPAIAEALQRIARRGRQAGLHLILGAQRLAGDAVGGTMTRDNLPVRLVGHVADPQAAFLATSIADSGAEKLAGKGDFIAVNGARRAHFQAAYIPPDQLAAWAKRYPLHRGKVGRGAVPARESRRDIPGPALDPLPAVPSHPVPVIVQMPEIDLGPEPSPQERLVVHKVREYHCAHSKWPSLNWLDRACAPLIGQRYFHRDRARQLIRRASRTGDARKEDSG